MSAKRLTELAAAVKANDEEKALSLLLSMAGDVMEDLSKIGRSLERIADCLEEKNK